MLANPFTGMVLNIKKSTSNLIQALKGRREYHRTRSTFRDAQAKDLKLMRSLVGPKRVRKSILADKKVYDRYL